ncbi:MAG: adenylate/guanylate cyclase domain-containing protein [Actinomycetota bacterium]
MAKLSAGERAGLPDRAFAYIGPKGERRLPIHDEAHVRNALSRFERVKFEDDAARERTRLRLLRAAKRYAIVPVGFITGQIRTEGSDRGSDLSSLPTGSLTFLLTDIEGSTILLRQLAGAYGGVLRDVRGIIRTVVRRHRGRKVDAHGDEYFTVFERPGSAVQAAIDIQHAMHERTWPRDLSVRVRAGLHTGRPTLTESGYVGIAVHTTARICSAGHGGQIIISGKTMIATRDLMPAGVTIRDLGQVRLAGLGRAVALHQVCAPGLPTRFPSLRTGLL